MANDKEAFTALVVGSRDRLFSVAYRILRDRARAEDAVQQTFLIAWQQLHKLRDVSKVFAARDLCSAVFLELTGG